MAPLEFICVPKGPTVNHICTSFWQWRTYASVWHSFCYESEEILEVDAELKEAVKAFKKN